jgi:hypothetical protein
MNAKKMAEWTSQDLGCLGRESRVWKPVWWDSRLNFPSHVWTGMLDMKIRLLACFGIYFRRVSRLQCEFCYWQYTLSVITSQLHCFQLREWSNLVPRASVWGRGETSHWSPGNEVGSGHYLWDGRGWMIFRRGYNNLVPRAFPFLSGKSPGNEVGVTKFWKLLKEEGLCWFLTWRRRGY